MISLLQALQGSTLAAVVRDSPVLYPAANVAHVLAVLVFFAAVATIDLRLVRVIRGMPVAVVIGRLRPVSVAALGVIAATGGVLFLPEAVKIAQNPAFLLKLAAIALALANVGASEWLLSRHGEMSRAVRATAGLSLALWLAVAALGRLIAYL